MNKLNLKDLELKIFIFLIYCQINSINYSDITKFK